jgi:hypothetical protein
VSSPAAFGDPDRLLGVNSCLIERFAESYSGLQDKLREEGRASNSASDLAPSAVQLAVQSIPGFGRSRAVRQRFFWL